MINDDLLFLIVFVVLPTAIVVSGFWLFVVIRRQPTRIVRVTADSADQAKSTHEDRVTAQPDELQEPVVILATIDSSLIQRPTGEPPLHADDEESVALPVQAQAEDAGEVDDQRQAIEDFSPLAADLLYTTDEEDESLDQETQALESIGEMTDEEPLEDELLVGQTEEIPTVDAAPAEDEENEAKTPEVVDEAEEERRPGTDELPTPDWEISDDELHEDTDTGPEPEEEERRQDAQRIDEDPDDETNDDDEDEPDDADEDQSGTERRKPDRKLMPGARAAERASRRGRHGGRRVPRLPRLRRDEGGMEGGDGTGGVLL